MTGPVFVDTNVLLYQWDASAGPKRARAAEWLGALWRERSGRLSYQVLAEFYVTATQKLRPALPPPAARRYVRSLLAWEPVVLDDVVVEAAWRGQDRFHLSWWDALIVGAAQRAECRVLLSEDFQAGQQFDGLRVVDPFRSPPVG